MSKEQALENFYIVKEASDNLSRVERYALMVDQAATKSLPRHHAHRVKLECHYDDPIPLNKKAALENYYLLKEAEKADSGKSTLRGIRAMNPYEPMAGAIKAPMGKRLLRQNPFSAYQHFQQRKEYYKMKSKRRG